MSACESIKDDIDDMLGVNKETVEEELDLSGDHILCKRSLIR